MIFHEMIGMKYEVVFIFIFEEQIIIAAFGPLLL